MKIALCSDYFYPKIGGITVHIENLAKALESRGHEVFIVTKMANFDDSIHGLKVIRVKSLFRSSQTLDIPYTDELLNIFKIEKPNIIHVHHAFSPISLFSLAIGKKLKIKTILTNHSIQFLYDVSYLWKPFSYILFPLTQYINYADKIIAVSKAAATFISHFTDKNVEVIPNGVNVLDFAPKTKIFDGKSILFVGRLVYRKGIHRLLNIMLNVVKENSEARLVIVGSGYLSSTIKLAVKTLKLQENVILKGKLSKNELIEEYRRANVFILPSVFGESFGIVLLEAMASKTPIVAIAQGGVKEIIKNGETGLLVEEKNKVKKLAENINLLLKDKTLSEKIALNAFREVQKYDWNTLIKEIERIYEEP
ncbi:MAG: glycosyltransferase family 4 protein [Candidatus Methanomethylicia archaeon]|nr:glycosyltransferase family 4 protein [Candidatus Methanomethylicia archaeon]